jgi:putative flippase GtrA
MVAHSNVDARMAFLRQIAIFAFVGIAAVIVHYGALIGLVELMRWDPVPATLVGYICGGIVSYILNRRHTYESDRPHGEAIWRFAVVAALGFFLTWLLMYLLSERIGLGYLFAQTITTLIVMVWNFVVHKWFTFGCGVRAPAAA